MDRIIAYPGAIPLETDVLNTNRFAMLADGALARAVLGDGPIADGLQCVPTAPASMSVVVAPGAIFASQPVDASAYGSLGADTAHSVVKIGQNLDAQTFALTAPSTPGQSQNFLLQAAFVESDGGSAVVPYYNPSNPSQPYSGPDNSGTPQMTLRQQRVALVLKPGAAAAAGTQTTPAADPGYVPLYVVTVPAGATSLSSGAIAVAPGAPFVGPKLTARAPLDSPALTGAPTAPTPSAGDNSTKLATTAFVQASAAGLAGSIGSVPVGGAMPFFGGVAPARWLLCAGQQVSRTIYAALFAAISTTYGAGDGSTTFNLPDMRGRVPFGLDAMGGVAANRVTAAGSGIDGATIGAAGGDQRMQQHAHPVSDPTHAHPVYDPGHRHEDPYSEGGVPFEQVPGTNGSAGSGRTDFDQPRVYTGGAATGIGIGAAATGITVGNAGAGGSGNMPPALMANWIIYAGA